MELVINALMVWLLNLNGANILIGMTDRGDTYAVQAETTSTSLLTDTQFVYDL